MRDGAMFAGYTVERRLGQGGMGAVYLARHPRLPRLTALKLLNEELFSDSELRARFEREADLVAQLEHPNIVTVFDRGADDGRLWISMQYIDGVDAATVEPLTLPPDRATQIVAETAKALDFAHRRGVLHRDVKPANILLAKSSDGQQRVYLTDFGIARVVDDAGSRLTRTGTFTATLDYASPEQLTGAPMDGSADQYSLACTLYWLLTGSVPFESVHPAAVIQGHLQQPPPSVRTARPALPAAMDAVLARAMAKRPADRFASCAEFAEAAQRALTGQAAPTTVARPLTPAQPMPMPMRSAPAPQQQAPYPTPQYPPTPHGGYGYRPMPPPQRSNTGLVVGLSLGLVVLIAAGVGIWAALANQTPPQRHLDEARLAFPHVLPAAEIAAGQEYDSGRGFGETNCSGTVFGDVLKIHWIWMANQPDPELGTPDAQWQCGYAGSYMFPADHTRWPEVRIFRYESADEVKKVMDTFVGSTRDLDVNNGKTYTNFKWGSTPESAPRIATVFPDDPARNKFIMYSYGLGARNDPSMAQLLDWWKTIPLQ